jgi:predicted dehydrogenase
MSKACTSQTRWGIAGYGDVVQRRVAPAVAATNRCVLAGIWGRNIERARATASAYGAYGTDDLSDLCGRIDVLYVATPVIAHLAVAAAACRAGCHVLVEKPLSAGLGDPLALHELAQTRRRRVGVAYYRRLMPHVQWLRREIARGRFGAPLRAAVIFSSPFDPADGDPKAWRLDRRQAGGGVLADAGSHRLDLLAFLFGPPSTLEARFANVTDRDCERLAQVQLGWGCGLRADLVADWGSAAADRLELIFEGAHLVLEPLDCGTIQVRPLRGERDELAFAVAANSHQPLIEDFDDAVRSEQEPVCTLRDGLCVDRMLAAAFESSAAERRISLRGWLGAVPDTGGTHVAVGGPGPSSRA